MDSFVTAEKREVREERERLGFDKPLSAPSEPSAPSSSSTPLPAVATHSVTSVIPDPASWEHVRASPSPPPSVAPSPDVASISSDSISGTGMFDKASEKLRELSSTVTNKIEQLASSHKEFQKDNPTPNQRTPVVSDAEREYHAAKDSEQRMLAKDLDREYEASLI